MSLYLNLLKQVLTRSLFFNPGPAKLEREQGKDWPVANVQNDHNGSLVNAVNAETMIGIERLENIEHLAIECFQKDIPGDLMECGVWRGGAGIFMRAILNQNRAQDRYVWVADSFEGLPKPDPSNYPVDEGDQHHGMKFLAVSLEEVKANFARYGLLDERVKFLKGWFKDSLQGQVCSGCDGDGSDRADSIMRCPYCQGAGRVGIPKELALLRIDADMYEGVSQALGMMYPKVSPGGFVIIDDYQNIPRTRQAVDDYRAKHGITAELVKVDWCAVWWRKP